MSGRNLKKFMRYAIPVLFVCLSACGGSQNQVSQAAPLDISELENQTDLNEVNPKLPRIGFADHTSFVGGGSSFELSSVRYLRDGSTSFSPVLGDSSLDLFISNDGGEITLELEGRRYLLEAIAREPGSYVVSDPEPRGSDIFIDALFQRTFAPNQFVEYAVYDLEEGNLFFVGEGDEENEVYEVLFDSTGLYVFGYESDPQIASHLTGSATYDGLMSVLIAGLGQYGYAVGDTEISVDFEESTISGQAVMRSAEKPGRSSGFDLQTSQINLSIEPGIVIDGAFSGEVVLQDAFDVTNPQTSETITISTFDGEYDGTFYGPVLDSVGGQLSGETVDDTGSSDVAIVGAFIGSR